MSVKNLDYILDLLGKIVAIDSPTGFCNNIIDYLEKHTNSLIEKYNSTRLSYTKNRKGNLIITYKGTKDYTLGFASHVDTLGAIVRSIKADGTLRFSNLGGPILSTYDGEYCKVYTRDGKIFNGTFLSNANAVHVHPDSRTLSRSEENMHIRLDNLVKSKSDTANLGISNGDFICLDPKFQITDTGFIKSRFLDDKLHVAIMFGIIDSILSGDISVDYTIHFVLSTYEEVGHGCSSIPDCDEFISLDMGCVGLDLSGSEEKVSICCKDGSGPYDYNMTTILINLCKELKLDYAVDVYPMYSSDLSASLRGGNDVRGALIGAGTSASHGMERSHVDGVKNCYKLIEAYIKYKA